jgi:serine protease Do
MKIVMVRWNMKRVKLIAVVLSILLVLSVSLAGCSLLPELFTSTPAVQNEVTPTSPVTTTGTSTTSAIQPGWTAPVQTTGNGSMFSFADLVAGVRSAVVAVNTEVVSYDFFNRATTQEGAGSGWIIDSNGIIVTNYHVVEGAQTITVTLDDGRTFPSTAVYADSVTDLAVVKINAQGLPVVAVGDSSKMRVGDPVVAIGNPLGLGISAKPGWVSRLEVPLEVSQGQTLYNLIETDAAINPGNSGGALINMSSQVIGITSAKISMEGVEGMGYAISINQAMPIIQQLIQKGYVVRPTLGLSGLYTVDSYVVYRYRTGVDTGVFVTAVDAGSPAEKAGIRVRDVITAFNNKPVTTADELLQAILATTIGQTVSLTYYRGTVSATVTAVTVETTPPIS